MRPGWTGTVQAMIQAIVAASTATGIAMALGGIAAVLVVSAIFYLVGRSEEGDRARDERDRAAAGLPALGDPPAAGLPAVSDQPADDPATPRADGGDGARLRAPASARGRRRR
jgi:hypothetical protein